MQPRVFQESLARFSYLVKGSTVCIGEMGIFRNSRGFVRCAHRSTHSKFYFTKGKKIDYFKNKSWYQN